MGEILSVAELPADLIRLGREVIAHQDRLRYRPLAVLTPDRLDMVRRHKLDPLAILHRRYLRWHVADLIRQARRNPDLAIALRDAWRERIAVVTIDSGLTDNMTSKKTPDNPTPDRWVGG